MAPLRVGLCVIVRAIMMIRAFSNESNLLIEFDHSLDERQFHTISVDVDDTKQGANLLGL
jgi:hypothetical protein